MRGERPAGDAERDTWLATRGALVLRYPARAILDELDAVVQQIVSVAAGRLAARA